MSLTLRLKDVKYKPDQTIIKKYGCGDFQKIKVIKMKYLRTSGIECDDKKLSSVRGTVNDSKLDESIIRAKNKIFELAYCNPWDYFFTGTLDSNKYNRTDLDKYHKDLTKWLSNQGAKLNCKINYLLIPELHSDGKSWHIHGFLQGLPQSELKRFVIGDTMGKKLADKVKNGDTVYNWLAYEKKFGFCDLEPIHNHEAVSKYITKYISKDLAHSVTELNAHLYYHSRGLQTAIKIKQGSMSADVPVTYSNEYCSISWLNYDEELLQALLHSFVEIDYYHTRGGL